LDWRGRGVESGDWARRDLRGKEARKKRREWERFDWNP